jgi:hypothetical protein
MMNVFGFPSISNGVLSHYSSVNNAVPITSVKLYGKPYAVGDIVYEHYKVSQHGKILGIYEFQGACGDSYFAEIEWLNSKKQGQTENIRLDLCVPFSWAAQEHERKAKKFHDIIKQYP